jgi:Zn finger protein HypA/HybF involved in hydrogenase expression
MSQTLQNYGDQLKSETMRIYNDERIITNVKQLNMKCFKCNTSIILNLIIDSKEPIYTISKLKKHQSKIFCPICGFDHDLSNTEITTIWQ